METHLSAGEATKVVIDFRKVTCFSSTVINTLTLLLNQLSACDGTMAVCSLSLLGREVLTTPLLDTVLKQFPSPPETVAYVRQ